MLNLVNEQAIYFYDNYICIPTCCPFLIGYRVVQTIDTDQHYIQGTSLQCSNITQSSAYTRTQLSCDTHCVIWELFSLAWELSADCDTLFQIFNCCKVSGAETEVFLVCIWLTLLLESVGPNGDQTASVVRFRPNYNEAKTAI